MVELGEIKREFGIDFASQVRRELADRSIPRTAILSELQEFEAVWREGEQPQRLGGRYHFKKVHDAEWARRGILLYEIYVARGRNRAIVAWFDTDQPGQWVAIFKKQGNAQSKTILRTAGECAVNLWRQRHV